jgi:hypothetical protein
MHPTSLCALHAAVATVVLTAAAVVVAAPPECSTAVATQSLDYGWFVGSATATDPDGDPVAQHSTYRWLANGAPLPSGSVGELLHLPLDGDAGGSDGDTPSVATGLQWGSGRWGSAVSVTDGGGLGFLTSDALTVDEGTVEMWVAPTHDGSAPIYAERWHVLLHYTAPNGDWLGVVQSATDGVLYVGGEVAGSWISAWSSAASTRFWAAGSWHHVACTWSETTGRIRLYLDGRLMADTTDGPYGAPSTAGSLVAVGSDVWGTAAAYWLDEVRILDRAIGSDEVRARSRRTDPPAPMEVWLSSSDLPLGAEVTFELTPSDGTGTGAACTSDGWTWSGVPVSDPDPPSTLLPEGSTTVDLEVTTTNPGSCRWAVGTLPEWSAMTTFDSGAGSTAHTTQISGLDPDPSTVNRVWVRTDLAPDFALELVYRSLGPVRPHYPKTGNLWGVWELMDGGGLERVAEVDLLLGADALSPGQIGEVRRLNPHIRVLASMNAVEHPGLPDSYYLKDTSGQRIEVWPGSYRLNLTKTEVAEHQALLAVQRIIDSDLVFDGVFFDNVFTDQSWLDEDIYGNPVALDADEDGIEDDPAVLDAAWKAGVLHELSLFRQLMPNALASGHAMDIFEPGIAERFNGISFGFITADVIEGERSFTHLWRLYEAWERDATAPVINMFESSPIDQLAYGYDYAPWDKVPPETEELGRTFYPWMRFGLALTLMRDGYFAHEWGDTWHGNDWWYDELDHDLGLPLGPPRLVDLGGGGPANQIVNGSFETPIVPPWSFWVETGAGAAATVGRDTADAAVGSASARVDISAISGVDWHVQLAQDDRSLIADTAYNLTFWVRADVERSIVVLAQKGAPDWDLYGLWAEVPVTPVWQQVTVPFTANTTASDASIQLLLGTATGSVWLDGIQLAERPPDVYRRDFTHGAVLLNGTDDVQTVPLEAGFSRIYGDQAPRHQVIVDDGDPGFATSGSWTETSFDSGEWQASGPFYHDWGDSCRVGSGAASEASWPIEVPFADTYTIAAWWPAAPEATGWSASARYRLVVDGAVVASATFDQRTGGDRFHTVTQAALDPATTVEVRLSCLDGADCVADALHVISAARYNDGAAVSSVELAPLDGIVLSWTNPLGPGDVDRDGDLDGADILALVRAIYGELTALDVDLDDDEAVDSRDLTVAVDEVTAGL